ncbi:MAG: leucine-rich repeat domain-containing protein [Clostridia bacterium]|nr:leucine-rich repeat domain-containing protein [Clostridia bacterium]
MKKICVLFCMSLCLVLMLQLGSFADAPAFSEDEFYDILKEAEALAVLYTDLEWSPQSAEDNTFLQNFIEDQNINYSLHNLEDGSGMRVIGGLSRPDAFMKLLEQYFSSEVITGFPAPYSVKLDYEKDQTYYGFEIVMPSENGEYDSFETGYTITQFTDKCVKCEMSVTFANNVKKTFEYVYEKQEETGRWVFTSFATRRMLENEIKNEKAKSSTVGGNAGFLGMAGMVAVAALVLIMLRNRKTVRVSCIVLCFIMTFTVAVNLTACVKPSDVAPAATATPDPDERTPEPGNTDNSPEDTPDATPEESPDPSEVKTADGWSYTLISDESGETTAKLFRCSLEGPEIVVPSEIGGFKVSKTWSTLFDENGNAEKITKVTIPCIEIAKGSFKKLTNVSEVVIDGEMAPVSVLKAMFGTAFSKNKVTKITVENGKAGDSFFEGLENLKEVVFKGNISQIGDRAFRGCAALETVDAHGIVKIGNSAFEGCKALKAVPSADSVQAAGQDSFKGCSSVENIDLPCLTSVADNAFSGCTSLKKAVLTSVKEIGKNAFFGDALLKVIEIPKAETVNDGAFAGCAALERADMSAVKTVSDGAFSGCTALKSFTFNSIENIGAEAFKGCASLEKIDFPAKIKSLGEKAFSGCSSVTELVLPEVGTRPGSRAFDGLTALKKISFATPAAAKSFAAEKRADGSYSDDSAFGRLDSAEIVFSDDTEAIPNGMFANTHLYGTVTVKGAALKSIGEAAFQYCTHMEEIIIPETIEVVSDSAFEWCLALKKAELPAALKKIGDRAFNACCSLTAINLPANVSAIGKYAFASCDRVTEVKLPAGITEIPEGAFKGCADLKSFSHTCTKVGNMAFAFCTSLESVDFGGTPVLGEDVFKCCFDLYPDVFHRIR